MCGNEVDKLVTSVKDGQYISERCEKCMGRTTSAEYSNKYRRDRDKEDFRRDTIQSGDPEFLKEFPDEARGMGYSEDQMRKYG